MRAKSPNRFAGLHQKGFVILKLSQRTHDRVISFPASRRPPGSSVDDQLIRIFCDLRIKIVHEHAHRGFLMPTFATHLAAARRANNSLTAHNFSVSLSNFPSRRAAAIISMSRDMERSSINAGTIERT